MTYDFVVRLAVCARLACLWEKFTRFEVVLKIAVLFGPSLCSWFVRWVPTFRRTVLPPSS